MGAPEGSWVGGAAATWNPCRIFTAFSRFLHNRRVASLAIYGAIENVRRRAFTFCEELY